MVYKWPHDDHKELYTLCYRIDYRDRSLIGTKSSISKELTRLRRGYKVDLPKIPWNDIYLKGFTYEWWNE